MKGSCGGRDGSGEEVGDKLCFSAAHEYHKPCINLHGLNNYFTTSTRAMKALPLLILGIQILKNVIGVVKCRNACLRQLYMNVDVWKTLTLCIKTV